MKTPLLTLAAGLLASCAMLGSRTHEIVYVAEASGGGWSGAPKARAAMTSLEGIADLHMSGARAVFQLERGAKIDEDTLAAAFETQGMTLESFERVERPLAKARWDVDSGVTWAKTAAKVREALIAQTGALDVYFEDTIEILMPDDRPLPQDVVKTVLTESEVKFTRIDRAGAPWTLPGLRRLHRDAGSRRSAPRGRVRLAWAASGSSPGGERRRRPDGAKFRCPPDALG